MNVFTCCVCFSEYVEEDATYSMVQDKNGEHMCNSHVPSGTYQAEVVFLHGEYTVKIAQDFTALP